MSVLSAIQLVRGVPVDALRLSSICGLPPARLDRPRSVSLILSFSFPHFLVSPASLWMSLKAAVDVFFVWRDAEAFYFYLFFSFIHAKILHLFVLPVKNGGPPRLFTPSCFVSCWLYYGNVTARRRSVSVFKQVPVKRCINSHTIPLFWICSTTANKTECLDPSVVFTHSSSHYWRLPSRNQIKTKAAFHQFNLPLSEREPRV